MSRVYYNPGSCFCEECVGRIVNAARHAEMKAQRPVPEYDWEDLERKSDLARQHRYPDGAPWVFGKARRRR